MFLNIIITPPRTIGNETVICNNLFAEGLPILHLRKPDASESELREYIEAIEPRFRRRIVLHSHYHLALEYNLRGIHLKSTMGNDYALYENHKHISISCHSFEEVDNLKFKASYAFISPVFDSISKEGYMANAGLLDKKRVAASKVPLIALGGIDGGNIARCRMMGFAGAATIGFIWANPNMAIERFRVMFTPNVLSIAGFDPTSGAGVSADIKTATSCGTYAMGVVSAITFQNADSYEGTEWTSTESIVRQIEVLMRQHTVEVAKIGMIENAETLIAVCETLRRCNPDIRIIWDPILKATAASSSFHGAEIRDLLNVILKYIDLITPNSNELATLFLNTSPDALSAVAKKSGCAVLHKGGHTGGTVSSDILYMADGTVSISEAVRLPYDKHGTGCFLSSAIMAYWSKGYTLPAACRKAQSVITGFISSNETRLGYARSKNDMIDRRNIDDCCIMYISDHREGYTIAEQVEAVCKGGVDWIQLRMKDSSDDEMLEVGKLVKAVCKRYGATFIINDRVHIAKALDADGVHLGKNDMDPAKARQILGEDKIIGATCNTFADIEMRNKQAVDYIGVGPFRYTTTKKNLSPVLGLEGYSRLVCQCREAGISLPMFAIGGITTNDFADVMSTGVTGIALSGEILRADDITAKASICMEIIKRDKTTK